MTYNALNFKIEQYTCVMMGMKCFLFLSKMIFLCYLKWILSMSKTISLVLIELLNSIIKCINTIKCNDICENLLKKCVKIKMKTIVLHWCFTLLFTSLLMLTFLFYTDVSSQETTKFFTAQKRIRKVSLFL